MKAKFWLALAVLPGILVRGHDVLPVAGSGVHPLGVDLPLRRATHIILVMLATLHNYLVDYGRCA